MVNTPNVPFIQTPDLARRHGQAINQMLSKTDPLSVSGTVTTLKTDFSLDTGYVYKIAGTQVLGPRITGWAADTGTDKRTANATYTAPTISNPPTQAEVQAIANALQAATRTIKSLKADLTTQGIIGA